MARTRNQGSKWIRPAKRARIYARDNHHCLYCGCDLMGPVMATLDHVLPCELGGSNHESNLVTACLHCNSSKRDLPLADFLQVLADRGSDPSEIRRRIRNATRRKLK